MSEMRGLASCDADVLNRSEWEAVVSRCKGPRTPRSWYGFAFMGEADKGS